MWLFQDQELVNGANGIIVSIINNMGELLFPQNIDSSIAGDYVFRMESGAGIVSVTLAVIVESRFEGWLHYAADPIYNEWLFYNTNFGYLSCKMIYTDTIVAIVVLCNIVDTCL